MREVNETFALPNPPSWYDTAAKDIMKTVATLNAASMLPRQGPARVSLKSHISVAQADYIILFIAANT